MRGVRAREPAPAAAARRDQHAGVDLADRRSPGSRRLLDDAPQPAAAIAHDAAVAGRIGELRRQQREAVGAGAREQRAQRLGAQQRHVAVEHQHLVRIGNRGHRLLQRVAGAELLALLRPVQRSDAARTARAHALAAVAVDHVDRFGRELRGQLEHMRQQRLAGQRLQHLGQLRAHALALAGREDHDRQRRAAWVRLGGRDAPELRGG